jgi:integrase
LLSGKRSAITVNDVWCSAARAVFAWAAKKRKLSSNPFKHAEVAQRRKERTRQTPEFLPHEAERILKACLGFDDISENRFEAARRWVPWLCAYTGSRPGEITQLRGRDVIKQEGIWTIQITPEAGTVKTSEARTVPLHEHLIAQGFVKFARATGDGPLFYNNTSSSKVTKIDPTNPPRPRWVKTRDRLAEWVRKDVGVSDKSVRPNHAWRHLFKRRAARAKSQRSLTFMKRQH